MECNRDEAIRAITIAEKKLADKDFGGAKKFTLKAQSLYPGLGGISQMLVVLNVYISSEKKVNGESDWYAILDVKPSDDDETIRKQYRKLALVLHPDKNKSVGADGAFKILSEAWSLLSDKAKRSAYDQRRNKRGIEEKVLFQSGGRGVDTCAKRATSKPKNCNGVQTRPASVPYWVPPPTPVPSPVVHPDDSFWTVCGRCRMNYEYPRVYLNCTLLCPRCQKPFHALEMAAPVNIPNPAHPNLNNSGEGTATAQSWNWDSSSRTEVADPSIASKAANLVAKVSERFKRESEGQQPPSKSRKMEDEGGSKISHQTVKNGKKRVSRKKC